MQPELLAPVGDLDMCYAAVHNGANAVYVGVPGWNARGRTMDFSYEDLGALVEFCHLRGVQVYFALNILIFDRELPDIIPELVHWIALHPDAFIVQDIGLVRLIRHMAPHQEVHASTQMTLASSEGVALVQELGISRCVVAREMSVIQIQRLHEQIPQMELEAFVHGALCVSYSGQCLTSESFGGRSANRGQCAQSCRLPYRIVVDGQEMELHGRHYLFSPKDLCALEQIPALIQAGVSSFKIEGRLKSPEYVAAVTSSYRAAIDQKPVSATLRDAMESLFSRGLSWGWLQGVNHQQLVHGYYSNHHGAYLGTVQKVKGSSVWVAGNGHCQAGDGVLFVHTGTDYWVGGRVYGISKDQQSLRIEFSRDLDLTRIQAGFSVFRNDSPALEKEVRRSFSEKERFKRIPIHMLLEGQLGVPLVLHIHDQDNHSVCITGELPLEMARTPRDHTALATSILSGLMATAYTCPHPQVNLDPRVFINEKMLRTLKQHAVQALDQQRLARPSLLVDPALGFSLLKSCSHNAPPPTSAKLSVLVRRMEQLDGLKNLPLESVVLDLDYGKECRGAVQKARTLGIPVGLATLRVHKQSENHTLRALVEAQPDFILVRSLGALGYLKNSDIPLHGDYSLNACNRISVDWFQKQGLHRLHPSWDLNQEQLFDLVNHASAPFLEVSLHQYMPTFHMEHCLFAAHLSSGERFPFCGKVCESHNVEVIDHKGNRHFLESDAQCRNTLFNGRAQSALKLFHPLQASGVCQFRLELLHESPEQVQRKVSAVLGVLSGNCDVESALHHMDADEKYGISEGQLFNSQQWKDRKKGNRHGLSSTI